jgi:hypothetical protein
MIDRSRYFLEVHSARTKSTIAPQDWRDSGWRLAQTYAVRSSTCGHSSRGDVAVDPFPGHRNRRWTRAFGAIEEQAMGRRLTMTFMARPGFLVRAVKGPRISG